MNNRFLNNFLTSGKVITNEDPLRLYQFLNILLVIGPIYSIIFMPTQLRHKWYLSFTSSFLLMIISIFLLIALRKGFKLHYAATSTVTILLAHFSFISIRSSDPTMILWLYMYPLVAIFLLGIRHGMFWSIMSFFSCTGILLSKVDFFSPFFFRTMMIHALIIIIVYFFENSRKKSMNISNELREQTFQASKMATLGEMASGIAHEINNPLSIIHGNANNLYKRFLRKNGTVPPEEVKKIVDKITSTVSRIDGLVGGLRSFSKTTNNSNFKNEKILHIVRNTINLCMERIKSDQIDLQIGLISENLSIKCNKSEISQVLINLLSNSHYEVLKSNEKWIKIDIEPKAEKKQIIISVSDSGTGIPENIRNQIFAPFFTTKEIGSGAGIGLGISRKIIEKHGGRLFLDTDSPVTTFKIQLAMYDLSGDS